MGRRIPTNIALDPNIARRVRLVAAASGKRVCDIVEELIRNGLPEMELQAKCDFGSIMNAEHLRALDAYGDQGKW